MSILHVHAPQQRDRTAPCAVVTDPVFAACLSRPSYPSSSSSDHHHQSPSPSPLVGSLRSSISSLRTFSTCSEYASSPPSDKRSLCDSVITTASPSPPHPMQRQPPPPPRRALSPKPDPLTTSTTTTADASLSHKTMDQDSNRSADLRDEEPTAISGLSILSDESDEFYQRSLEHLRRDRQHLRNAASQPRPFARARHTTLSLDKLDRKKAASDSSVVDKDDASLASRTLPARRQSAAAGLERTGAGFNASQNPPREWGKKGRSGSDLLRRISSAGHLDSAPVADVEEETDHEPGPLPGGQDSPSPLSSRRGAPRPARPTGPRVRRSTDDLMERGRRELGRSGDPKRDESSADAKQREIESVKDKAVATSRLADAARRSLRVPGSLASAFRRTEQSVEGTMDNILGQLNGGRGTAESSKAGSALTHRPSDSRDLLRQFARASSSTPSPQTRKQASGSDLDIAQPEQTSEDPATPDASPLRGVVRSSPSISKVPTRSSSLRSLRGSSRRSSKRVSQNFSPERVDEVADRTVEETPGAWVETPTVPKQELFVQEPRIPENKPADPLRSHPVTPDALDDRTGFGLLEKEESKTIEQEPPPPVTRAEQRTDVPSRRAKKPLDASTDVCPHCHEALPPTAPPTLWDVTAASMAGVATRTRELFVYKTAQGHYWPTRTFWLVAGVAAWLWLELWFCDVFCPYYCRFWFPSYTDMQISEPRFPFVLLWKLVLEPTQGWWRPGWRAWLALVEPRGWGACKRALWWALKRARLDWLFGPGDERLEGRWDWPWWWSYLYGAQYGVVDPNCIMCSVAGA